jgi:hypothetical protein
MEKNGLSRAGKIVATLAAIAAFGGWFSFAWKQAQAPSELDAQISAAKIQPEVRAGYSDQDNQITRIKQKYAPLLGISYSIGPRGVDLGNTNGFGYNPNDPWTVREKVLEDWAVKNENPLKYGGILDKIADEKKGDEAPQVRLLAADMDDCLHAQGDFSGSRPNKAQQALETRIREIGIRNPITPQGSYYTYHPDAPFDNRLSTVDAIVRADCRTERTKEFFGLISEYEEEAIRTQAIRALKDFNSNGAE